MIHPAGQQDDVRPLGYHSLQIPVTHFPGRDRFHDCARPQRRFPGSPHRHIFHQAMDSHAQTAGGTGRRQHPLRLQFLLAQTPAEILLGLSQPHRDISGLHGGRSHSLSQPSRHRAVQTVKSGHRGGGAANLSH